MGHVVLDTNSPFDVAWTGEVFLAASSRPVSEYSNDANIIGRVLDAEAQPLSEEFLIAEQAGSRGSPPDAEAIVMVYRGTARRHARPRAGPRGESIGAQSWKLRQGGCGYAVATNGAGFVVAVANRDGDPDHRPGPSGPGGVGRLASAIHLGRLVS